MFILSIYYSSHSTQWIKFFAIIKLALEKIDDAVGMYTVYVYIII